MKNKKLIIPILLIFLLLMKPKNIKIWDSATAKKIEELHPKIREKVKMFIKSAESKGIKLRITSGYRSFEEQNELYAKGRTKPGPIVTRAKGGQSSHNYALAFDVVPIVKDKADWNSPLWDKIGQLGKSFGFNWGGDWKNFVDKPHFDMLFNNTVAQLRNKHTNNEYDNGYIIV